MTQSTARGGANDGEGGERDARGEAARVAACQCGALRAACAGAPASVNLCACKACQRRTGGAFAYTAFYPEAALRITGEARTWRRAADSGGVHESSFCPACGTTVFARLTAAPGLVAVSAGCFAEPDFPPPAKFYWTASRHRWLGPLAGAADLDAQ